MKGAASVPTSRRLILLAALAASACGEAAAASPGDVVAQVQSTTAEVKSAKLSMNFTVSDKGGHKVGFSLQGPFQVGAGRLPALQMDFRQFGGSQERQFQLLSTGNAAFLGVRDQYYKLDDTQTRALAANGANRSGVGDLRVEDWITNPQVADGGTVDGAPAQKITGGLKAAQFFNDLAQLSRDVGYQDPGGLPQLDAQGRAALTNAVSAANVVMLAGRDDHVMRSLDIGIDLTAKSQQGLGDYGGAHLELTTGLSQPGQAISVRAPQNAQPYANLLSGG